MNTKLQLKGALVSEPIVIGYNTKHSSNKDVDVVTDGFHIAGNVMETCFEDKDGTPLLNVQPLAVSKTADSNVQLWVFLAIHDQQPLAVGEKFVVNGEYLPTTRFVKADDVVDIDVDDIRLAGKVVLTYVPDNDWKWVIVLVNNVKYPKE